MPCAGSATGWRCSPIQFSLRRGSISIRSRRRLAASPIRRSTFRPLTDVSRANSLAGVGLLLVPAWDFVHDSAVLARIAAMRAVEGGFAVARPAQEGLVAVSDPRGRLIAQTATAGRPEVLLVIDVASGSAPTVYARSGDWFARLMSGMAAAIVVAVVVDVIRLGRRTRGARVSQALQA